jgi:type IV secretion system protein VirB9
MSPARPQRISVGIAGLTLALAAFGQAGYERADDARLPPDPQGPTLVTGAAVGSPRPRAGVAGDEPDFQGVDLSAKEQAALALVKRWRAAPDTPMLSENGQVRFLFGATLPVIVCAPLRGTDIALQPGEIVKPDGVHTGDTVRWQVMPSVSGPVGNETTHLIVKPTDVGLSTNMIVGTDRRTYHFELVSRKEDWMPSVGFNYPEEIEAQWGAYQRKAHVAQTGSTLPGTTESLQSLDFNYQVEGAAAWKPLRVYSNGVKTVVQMPKSLRAGEAPALLVLGADDREEIVNYRLQGDRYIVDLVFEKAVLVLGVGRKQTKVTITHLH